VKRHKRPKEEIASSAVYLPSLYIQFYCGLLQIGGKSGVPMLWRKSNPDRNFSIHWSKHELGGANSSSTQIQLIDNGIISTIPYLGIALQRPDRNGSSIRSSLRL
jgi:hypothetical protein